MDNLVILIAVIALFGAVGWALYFYEREKNKELMDEIRELHKKVSKIESENKEKISIVIREICDALGIEERGVLIKQKVDRMFDRIEKEEEGNENWFVSRIQA